MQPEVASHSVVAVVVRIEGVTAVGVRLILHEAIDVHREVVDPVVMAMRAVEDASPVVRPVVAVVTTVDVPRNVEPATVVAAAVGTVVAIVPVIAIAPVVAALVASRIAVGSTIAAIRVAISVTVVAAVTVTIAAVVPPVVTVAIAAVMIPPMVAVIAAVAPAAIVAAIVVVVVVVRERGATAERDEQRRGRGHESGAEGSVAPLLAT